MKVPVDVPSLSILLSVELELVSFEFTLGCSSVFLVMDTPATSLLSLSAKRFKVLLQLAKFYLN